VESKHGRRAKTAAPEPIDAVLGVLCGKWSAPVVRELLDGPRRFGQLHGALSPVSAKTLTDRLRSLEEKGIVEREVFAEVPPRVVYSLTDLGKSLRGVMDAMTAWGLAHPRDLA
jgi:DNA-binding HxlR family transcriptional regulator